MVSNDTEWYALPITLIVSIVCLIAVSIQRRRGGFKRSPPGLWRVPILGSIPFLPNIIDHRQLTNLARKYGDIYQFYLGSRLVVVLCTYELVHEAFVKKAEVFSHRPVIFPLKVKKGIAVPSPNQQWGKHKRTSLTILNGAGFGRNVMERRIQCEVNHLLDELAKHTDTTLNPANAIKISIANVINSLLLNKKFDYEDTKFVQILEAMDEGLTASYLNGHMINVLHFTKLCKAGNITLQTFWEKMADIVALIKEQMSDHSREEQTHGFTSFLSLFKRKMGEDYNEIDALFIIRDLFIGGVTTTAASLLWGLLRIANQPEIMTGIQKEIDQEMGVRQPCLSDQANMVYTQAFILEIMRHTTVLPLGFPHMAAVNSELGGYYIPKGAIIVPSLWSAHMDEKEWTVPDVFDPTRFLGKDGNLIRKTRIMPFSIGKRVCPGESMARQEMFLFFTSILQRFVVSRPPGVDKIPDEGIFGISLLPGDFNLIISARN